MTRVQKVTPYGALIVMLLAISYSLIPFEFAQGVKCSAPLMGAKPNTTASGVGLVLPKEDCLSKGKSRLLVSAMLTLAAAITAAAVVALKPLSPQCHRGDHDACPQWWGNLLSENDSGFGCQCECHGGSSQLSY